MQKIRLIIVFCFLSAGILQAQFGYGLTASNDLYHRYKNPVDGIASPNAGSALLNIGAGPKFWIGGKKMSFSGEAQAVIGFLGFSSKDYKGLGTMAIPILFKLNFKGLSTFEREGKMGWSIGGGIQYNKTEIFGLSDEFASKGIKREFFRTYIIQAGYGFGISGFTAHGIVRYGFNSADKTNTLNIGLQYDFNAPMMKKISSPESEL
jgi:hypothetical protein